MRDAFLKSWTRRTAALAFAVAGVSGCERAFFTEPAAAYPGAIAVSYNLSASSFADPRAAFDSANNLRIRVTGPAVSIDTVLQFTPASETRIRLPVDSVVENQSYLVEVLVRRNEDVLLAGLSQTQIAPNEQAVADIALSLAPVAANAVATARTHSCALDERGAAFCWGANGSGQLGTGDDVASTTPVPVLGNLRFVEIAASNARSCGLTGGGEVYCWGSVATSPAVRIPARLVTTARFTSLSVGDSHACGLTADGTAFCWGGNRQGQIGTGDTVAAATPVAVGGSMRFTSISAGLQHTCAVRNDGRGFCWGWNALRQIGNGSSSTQVLTPAEIAGGHTFTQLTAGAGNTCGVTATASLCWGTNLHGSLGNGSATSPASPTPVPVSASAAFRMIRAGNENIIFTPVCGLTANGSAFCWGANTDGQLGTSATIQQCSSANVPAFGCSGTPVPVSGSLVFANVYPGGLHVCGLTSDKRLFCWGDNELGQLGTGGTADSSVPVAVSAGAIRWPRP